MARRPPETVANPARGVALVVAAVLVGLFLLRSGLDDSTTATGTDAGAQTDQGSDSSDDGGTDTGETTSTTVGARTPDQVKVIVLNGSGVSGAAKRFSTALGAMGYDLTNPDGGNTTLEPETTQVLYAEGFQADAAAVANKIGAPATGVVPLGTQTPGDIAGAQVIVVLAADRANDQTPETPT